MTAQPIGRLMVAGRRMVYGLHESAAGSETESVPTAPFEFKLGIREITE